MTKDTNNKILTNLKPEAQKVSGVRNYADEGLLLVKEENNPYQVKTIKKIEPKIEINNNIKKEEAKEIIKEKILPIPEKVIIKQPEVLKTETKKEEVIVIDKKNVLAAENYPKVDIDFKPAFNVDLMPEDAIFIEGAEKQKARKILFVWSFLSVIIFVSTYFVLDFYDKKEARAFREVESKLKEARSLILLNQDLSQKGSKLNNKIKLAELVLDNHIYWTGVLDFLEEKTVPTVFYRSITNNIGSGVTISAIAIDYESVARQLAALQKESLVKEVKVSNLGLQKLIDQEFLEAGFPAMVVKFDLNVKFDAQIFKQILK